jgi:hypothetical protein
VWAHLRAALVAVHVAAVVLGALPAPAGGMKRAAWRDPTVQDELAVWRGRLQKLGMNLSAAAFEDRLWDVATRFMAARAVVLKPFGPYYRHMGTLQTWRMFVAPHRYPARLHIDVYEHDHWVNIFEEGHPGPDWRQAQLEQDRFRSALFRYSWVSYDRSYRQFGRWVAREVRRDYPDAEAVRLRWFKYKTLDPKAAAAGAEPDGSFVLPLILPTSTADLPTGTPAPAARTPSGQTAPEHP